MAAYSFSGSDMGIYVHIPFCRSKCYYCGFYSMASNRLKEGFIRALCREMELRKDYLPQREAATLYFGGGTPSSLSLADTGILVERLEQIWHFKPEAERTIEMNPEDMQAEKLKGLKQLGFNRISVGVQSFHDDILEKINRRHTARQAEEGIELAFKTGFENIGLDLIIGLPGQTREMLVRDIAQATRLPVSHISVYMLSIDPGSVLEQQYHKGRFLPEEEEVVAAEYEETVERLKEAGFRHYEISNFARDGKYSVHNASYWQQKPYIGLGPSAHSYDLKSRQWNISNLKSYIDNLDRGILSFEREELSGIDRYNEYLMTNLRTHWGIGLVELKEHFGFGYAAFVRRMEEYIREGWAVRKGDRLCLTEKGWLISDKIFSELFLTEDETGEK